MPREPSDEQMLYYTFLICEEILVNQMGMSREAATTFINYHGAGKVFTYFDECEKGLSGDKKKARFEELFNVKITDE